MPHSVCGCVLTLNKALIRLPEMCNVAQQSCCVCMNVIFPDCLCYQMYECGGWLSQWLGSLHLCQHATPSCLINSDPERYLSCTAIFHNVFLSEVMLHILHLVFSPCNLRPALLVISIYFYISICSICFYMFFFYNWIWKYYREVKKKSLCKEAQPIGSSCVMKPEGVRCLLSPLGKHIASCTILYRQQTSLFIPGYKY